MVDDDSEGGSLIVGLSSGFPLDDLLEVSDQLADADICVPGYIPPPVGLYHPSGYFYGLGIEGIKTILLPDRNVASRFAQLAQGNAVRSDQQLRLAAGLLAFSQCLDVEIDPAIAFHELAHKEGNDVALSELAWFRTADNASVHDLLAVALERADKVSGSYRQHLVPALDLARPLKRWNRNYIITLKMVELEQLQIAPVERVLRLFEWMRDDFVFGGPAALLASVYFAPNSSPKRRVFKGKNSVDRDASIAGVRNAAWDLTHLSEFVRRVNEECQGTPPRYLFASFDKQLRQIAKLLLEFGTEGSAPGLLASGLSRWWSQADAERIAATLFGHIERIHSPEWKAKKASSPGFIGELIREGEQRVRESMPDRRG